MVFFLYKIFLPDYFSIGTTKNNNFSLILFMHNTSGKQWPTFAALMYECSKNMFSKQTGNTKWSWISFGSDRIKALT